MKKGSKHSNETIKKIREARAKQVIPKHTEEAKRKIGEPRRGDKHWNWKGGVSGTRIYHVWALIKERCYNPKYIGYSNYGGRGIKICEEWKNNPYLFCEWASSNGYKKGLTIERIDVNGDYEPSNCAFIPLSEQGWNRKNTIKAEYNDDMVSISKISKIIGIKYSTLANRIKMGWTGAMVFSEPQQNIMNAPVSVLQKDINGNIMAIYESIHDANRKTGCDYRSIHACCRDNRDKKDRIHARYGYIWEYAIIEESGDR
jgi:hypothetical protein